MKNSKELLMMLAMLLFIAACNQDDGTDGLIDDEPLVEIPCEFVSLNRPRTDERNERKILFTSENGKLQKVEYEYPEYEERETFRFTYSNNQISAVAFEYEYRDDDGNLIEGELDNIDFTIDNGKLTKVRLTYSGEYEDYEEYYDEESGEWIYEPNGEIIYYAGMDVFEIVYDNNIIRQTEGRWLYKESKENSNITIVEGELPLRERMEFDFIDDNLNSVKGTGFVAPEDENARILKGKIMRPKGFISNARKYVVSSGMKQDDIRWESEETFTYDDKVNPFASFNRDALSVLGVFGFIDNHQIFSVNNPTRSDFSEDYEGENYTYSNTYTYTYNDDDLPTTYKRNNSETWNFGYNCD